MVLEINNNEIIKRINYKPSLDSDGGSDYVNDTDTIGVKKVNDRWNRQDQDFQQFQKFMELFVPIVKSDVQLGFLYEDDPSKNVLNEGAPFRLIKDSSGLSATIIGGAHVIRRRNKNKIILPSAIFFDLLNKESPEMVTVGSPVTNLNEIQEDSTPDGGSPPIDVLNSNKRWYTIGHDGAESSPTSVVREKVGGSSVEWWFTAEFKIYDYMNVASGYDHYVEFSRSANDQWIRIISRGGQSNYLINARIDDGGGLPLNPIDYVDIDTGISRSVGEHYIQIVALNNRNEVYIDGTLAWNSTAPHKLNYGNRLRISSNDVSGGANYFDIYRAGFYESFRFSVSSGARRVVYIDTNNDLNYGNFSSLFASSEDERVLYDFWIQTGETDLLDEHITDYRNLSRLSMNNNIHSDIVITDDIYVNNGIFNISGDVGWFRQTNSSFILIFNSTGFSNYFSASANIKEGDKVHLVGNWSVTWDNSYNANLKNNMVIKGTLSQDITLTAPLFNGEFEPNSAVINLVLESIHFLNTSGNGVHIKSPSGTVNWHLRNCLIELTGTISDSYDNIQLDIDEASFEYNKIYVNVTVGGAVASLILLTGDFNKFIGNNIELNGNLNFGSSISIVGDGNMFSLNKILNPTGDAAEFVLSLPSGSDYNHIVNNYITKGSKTNSINDSGTGNVTTPNIII